MHPFIETHDFVEEVKNHILSLGQEAQKNEEWFVLSLCGGKTPLPLYQSLATQKEALDWQRVLITFGDERIVPPDHTDSNYRMAKESLLDHLPIPQEHILRMQGELPAREAAHHYESQLKAWAQKMGTPLLTHNLILLGMGEDGHTASLFPETAALQETERWVVENYVPQLDTHRLTFTYPLICAAKQIYFLITGEKKRALFKKINTGVETSPAAQVSLHAHKVTWFLG